VAVAGPGDGAGDGARGVGLHRGAEPQWGGRRCLLPAFGLRAQLALGGRQLWAWGGGRERGRRVRIGSQKS